MMANSEKYLPKTLLVKEKLAAAILNNEFGPPGSYFIPVRNIAEKFKVSLVTAQNAVSMLREEGYIKLTGRRYVTAVIKTTTTDSKTLLGLLVPDLRNVFFAALADNCTRQAHEKGFEIIVASSNYSPPLEKQKLEMFKRQGVIGILSTPLRKSEQLYRALDIPFVLLGHDFAALETDCVMVQNFSAGQSVARHFIREGYRNFAYIGTENYVYNPRLQGFESALAENNIQLPPSNLVHLANDAEVQIVLDNFIASLPKSTGIFCFHDLLAVNCLQSCQRLDRAVPRDIGIFGFDDLPLASQLSPPLSSVAYPVEVITEMGIERLVRRMSGSNEPRFIKNYVDPELKIRASSQLHCRNEAAQNILDHNYQMI